MTTEASTRPTLRERRRVETAEQIVDAGRTLFAEQGYAATRAADIAKGAGVSDATLFRYFPSKSAIALAGVTDRVSFALGRLAAQPTELSELEAAQAVLADVSGLDLFGSDDPVVREIVLIIDTPELRTELDATINAAATETAEVLARRASRDTPTLRDRLYAHAIVGAIQAAAETWLEAPDGQPFTSLLGEAFALLDADLHRMS